MRLRQIGYFFLGMFLLSPTAFAVQVPMEPSIDWNEIIAIAINAVLVTLGVQVIKAFGPGLPTVVKQILALAGGPLLMTFLQPYLSDLLGFPIDLSALNAALAGLLTGLAAMGTFDVAKTFGVFKK